MKKEIEIKVIPNAKLNKIKQESENTYKVHLMTLPINGKANKELIKFLAAFFKIKKKSIKIIAGEKSQHKKIEINEDF